MAATNVQSIAELAEQYKDDTKSLCELARITETAERFEDMCTIMGKLVTVKKSNSKPLEVEERNMLSVAYKNVVGQRRASWRTLDQDSEGTENESTKKEYKKLVERELEQKCNEVLTLLEEYLLTVKNIKEKIEELNAVNQEYNAMVADNRQTGDAEFDAKKKEWEEKKELVETEVFYLKMCGDYYRYLAEFKTDDADKKKNASEKYTDALNLAKAFLEPTHPTRLGLALNASVCYYEIMKEPQQACDLAKEAFDLAIQKLDSLSDSTYKDSTLIMQLLRDNLTIWTSETADGQNPEDLED